MRVLVIGGTQFIGRLLVAELLKSKHEVTVLHRKRSYSLSKNVGNLAADRNDAEAMRRDIIGRRYDDGEVKATIRRVYETRGYLLDPHSAIAYLGLTSELAAGQTGVFLGTAHPAKFREIVEPVIGTTIETPAPLADALARPRHMLRIDATLEAVAELLDG